MTVRTPSFASPKNSRSSVSFVGLGRRTNNVQGFLFGLRLVGVWIPVLSVRGLTGPASEPGAGEPVVSNSGLGGVIVVATASSFLSPLLPSASASRAVSLSTWSRSRPLRSFPLLGLYFSDLSRSRSPLSFSAEPWVDTVAESLPFTLAMGGVSLPDAGSEVEGTGWAAAVASGACGVTFGAAGVCALIGVIDVVVCGGKDGLVDVGVC